MHQAEAREIEGRGATIRRVVLDFEFKKKIYAELNKAGDYGELSDARRQEELAELYELPIVDGKLALPDLRIEYDTADGDRAHIDLELETEHQKVSLLKHLHGIAQEVMPCKRYGREASASVG